ncbi:MAG: glycosyltransferase family 9 protein [Patescibacteria group bacterium]
MKYIFKSKVYSIFFFVIDVICSLFYLPLKLFKKPPDNIKNILIIRLDHTGDVVFSTSIPQNLKNHYNHSKITFLVSHSTRDIVINNPFVDEIICYDAPWFTNSTQNFKNILMLIKKLRAYKFDLGIDLRGDFRHILIMALSGIQYKVGYGITGGGFFLEKEVKYRQNVHTAEHNYDILNALGIDVIVRKPQIYTNQNKPSNLLEFEHSIIVHPYANYSSKNWLDERFARLIDTLSENYGRKVILVGSDKDISRIDNLKKLCNSKPINIAGKTLLTTLFEICKKSKLFVGVDSGPAHIAAATGIPTFVLFSSTNKSSEWKPIGDKVYTIEKDIDCQNCQKLNCTHNTCMELISVEDVLSKIKEVI